MDAESFQDVLDAVEPGDKLMFTDLNQTEWHLVKSA